MPSPVHARLTWTLFVDSASQTVLEQFQPAPGLNDAFYTFHLNAMAMDKMRSFHGDGHNTRNVGLG